LGIHKSKIVCSASKTNSNFENLDEMIFSPSRVEPAPLSPYLPGHYCKRALAAMEAASATSIKIRTLHEAHKNLPKKSLKDINLPDNYKNSKNSIGPHNYL
jgi:predicted MarR family transcription regulator